MYTSISSIEAE